VGPDGPRIGDWSALSIGGHAFRLRADGPDFAIDLVVRAEKPPVMHGADGISRKGAAEGQASHYYSLTRMATSGTVRVGDRNHAVTGSTWFDHEWATNQLGKDQVGWDWLSVHFDDGSELMLFQIRTIDGGRDPFSSGTWIGADGRIEAIANADFALEPVRLWKSPHSSGSYPVEWTIGIPRLGIALTVEAVMDDQELVLFPFAYWEGSVAVKDSSGRRVGRGYLEMTGYAGKLKGMQR
jgi:predicted secreted hydrolase